MRPDKDRCLAVAVRTECYAPQTSELLRIHHQGRHQTIAVNTPHTHTISECAMTGSARATVDQRGPLQAHQCPEWGRIGPAQPEQNDEDGEEQQRLDKGRPIFTHQV